VSAGCQRTLEPRHGWRLGPHSLGDLRLREACPMACLQERVEQRSFFPFDAADFRPDTRATHQLPDHLLMRSHV
jgi:hypothetical protein